MVLKYVKTEIGNNFEYELRFDFGQGKFLLLLLKEEQYNIVVGYCSVHWVEDKG